MVDAAVPERPQLIVGRGWAVYVGSVEPGRLHRHQAAQLAWCLAGTLKLEGAWGVLDTSGHYLPARVPHRLVALQPLRMVFLDPTIVGEAPTPGHAGSAGGLTVSQVDCLEHELTRWLQGHRTTPASAVDGLGDGRFTAVLQWLDQALDTSVRAEDAAKSVCLSSSRFMHWFTEVSGLPFRAYVRWLRLQRAVRTLANGSTLTEAAHWAGFADSAHLTRTFVATFGVRPASLRGASVVCADRAAPPFSTFAMTGQRAVPCGLVEAPREDH